MEKLDATNISNPMIIIGATLPPHYLNNAMICLYADNAHDQS